MSPYMRKKYFNVSELADYLDISRGRVYNLLRLPGFPVKKKGRIYLVDKQKFFAWRTKYNNIYDSFFGDILPPE